MHEHGLADHILDSVLQHPHRPPHTLPRAVTVQVPELGGVCEEVLQANLDHVCEHHGIPAVTVHVEVVPLLGNCQSCGAVAALDEQLTCPNCRSTSVRICGGETAVIKTCEYAAPT